MMRAMVTAAALGVVACATVPTSSPAPAPPTAGAVRTIRYETGPCFGACPVYAVTVSSDGRGSFEGRQHTTVTGTGAFTISPERFAEFERRLAPFRPAGERRLSTGAECNSRVATDMPSVEITWTGKGPQSQLYVYYGCDMERNAAMFEALRRAPEVLPIGAFIGTR